MRPDKMLWPDLFEHCPARLTKETQRYLLPYVKADKCEKRKRHHYDITRSYRSSKRCSLLDKNVMFIIYNGDIFTNSCC